MIDGSVIHTANGGKGGNGGFGQPGGAGGRAGLPGSTSTRTANGPGTAAATAARAATAAAAGPGRAAPRSACSPSTRARWSQPTPDHGRRRRSGRRGFLQRLGRPLAEDIQVTTAAGSLPAMGDFDGDGIDDAADACPIAAGPGNGCPADTPAPPPDGRRHGRDPDRRHHGHHAHRVDDPRHQHRRGERAARFELRVQARLPDPHPGAQGAPEDRPPPRGWPQGQARQGPAHLDGSDRPAPQHADQAHPDHPRHAARRAPLQAGAPLPDLRSLSLSAAPRPHRPGPPRSGRAGRSAAPSPRDAPPLRAGSGAARAASIAIRSAAIAETCGAAIEVPS